MIEIDLTSALTLYSGLLAALVLAIWLYTEMSVKRPQRHLGKQFLWRCIYCGCTYLDEAAQTVSQCPRCESFNTTEEGAEAPQLAAHPVNEPAPLPIDPRNTSKRKRRQRHRGPRKRR